MYPRNSNKEVSTCKAFKSQRNTTRQQIFVSKPRAGALKNIRKVWWTRNDGIPGRVLFSRAWPRRGQTRGGGTFQRCRVSRVNSDMSGERPASVAGNDSILRAPGTGQRDSQRNADSREPNEISRPGFESHRVWGFCTAVPCRSWINASADRNLRLKV